jgi:hypothetical protein
MAKVTVEFDGLVVDEYVEREEEYEGGKHELSSIRSRRPCLSESDGGQAQLE